MRIILETKRLVLREFTTDDAKMFYDLNKDTAVVQFVCEKPLESEAQALEILTDKILINQYEKFGYGRWAVHIKKNGLFIGWCGLKNDNGGIDLGYRYKKRFWGKGFGTEAAKAVLDYGFEQLNIDKIVAKAMEQNAGSIEIMKKIGMKFVTNKSFDKHYGVLYELTKDDWMKNNENDTIK